jgi:hypothetical protein
VFEVGLCLPGIPCGKKIGTRLFTGHYTLAFVSSESIALTQKMHLRKPLVEAHQHRGCSVSLYPSGKPA